MTKETPKVWEPGDSFDGYVIEAVIGEGAMGRVLRAHQVSVDRKVAIKVLLPHCLEDADLVGRFLREGRAASKIRSRHVVTIHDVRTRAGTPCIVMELLQGTSLERFIADRGVIDVPLAVEVLLAVCDAVASAHRVGIIHRDLKPANIFITHAEDGSLEPKVVDFGISRVDGEIGAGVKTQSRVLMGTPAYFAPEQTRGSKYITAQSDQYALGSILYECVTGQVAFPETELFPLIHKIGTGSFPPPRTINPAIPPELERVILQAMAKEATDRFESVGAFAVALLPFAAPTVRARWSPLLNRESGGRRASQAPDGTAAERPNLSDFAGTESLSRPPPAPRVEGSVSPRASTVSGLSMEVPVHGLAPSRRAVKYIGAALVGVLLVGAGLRLAFSPDETRAPEEYVLRVEATPPEATLSVDGRPLGVGRLEARYPRNGAAHVLLVSAPGWDPQQITFVDAPPEGVIRLARSPARAAVAPDAGSPRVVVTPVVARPPAAPTAPIAPAAPIAAAPSPGRHRRGSHREPLNPGFPVGFPGVIQGGNPAVPSATAAGDPAAGTNGASIR